ncbi:MAG: YdcF family protein [Gammaproteobacteria bacterium]|nr:YdcF family protein [Gammaproteobacteria bacterium]MBU1775383.1 YdcF family protein [Gammaproteobacteria bacterium]MBU1969460.1 YdcF family protein [Gammaproteobacteria bacterium]
MTWFLTNFIAAFLLPPLNLLLLAALGLWLWHKRPLLARVLLTSSVALLWLLSTPFVADALMHAIEGEPHAIDTKVQQADAIVVLGGGTYFHAPEYGGDTVGSYTLERLRFGARLQRETGKLILVTGGKPLGNDESEAAQMKRVLEQEFNVTVRWTEDGSNNTLENARLSRETLKSVGIDRIYLVTHAWHMPRALSVFEKAGFKVIPVPTAYTTRYRIDLLTFMPNPSALRNSRIFMHELIGIVWYRIKS